MSRTPRIAVPIGDPAGIGGEIAVKGYRLMSSYATVVLIGDRDVIQDAIEVCGIDYSLKVVDDTDRIETLNNCIPVVDVDSPSTVEYGEISATHGRAALSYVARAVELLERGQVDAVAGGPIDSEAIQRAEGSDSISDLLSRNTEADDVSIMLLIDALRVSHVTFHMPLREACDEITSSAVLDTIERSELGLTALGIDRPTIAVAGLNPHASVGGTEEQDHIAPAVEQARDAGIDAHGPLPPDSVFSEAANGLYDGVVAMYHDQGHIPAKLLGTRRDGSVESVAMIAGLPFVYTTVNHGPAFDIAGQGVAAETSIVSAVRIAAEASRGGC